MNESEYYVNLSNEKILHERLEHQSKMNVLIEEEEMNLFRLLKPTVTNYGKKWQVVYSRTVFGEGETLMKAIYDFNKQFNKKQE